MRLLILPLACILLLVGGGSARAEVRVQGALDPEMVEVGETAVLTISVEGAGSIEGTPRMNAPDGISMRSTGESRSFSFVNGKMSQSIQLQYVVIALRAGAFTIGPVEVQAGKRAYTVGPFRLTAANGSGGSSSPRSSPPPIGSPRGEPPRDDRGNDDSTPPILVDMRAEPAEVSVGQQTTLIVRFWQRADVAVLDARFVPPETEGFWKEDLPPERRSTTTRGGLAYSMTEIRMALFPTRPGDLPVSPARVHVQYRDPGRNRGDPFSIFGFGGREREAEPASNQVTVKVRPLPKPEPADFSGAVGRFTVRGEVDRAEARQGEPITWSITIEGEGNVSAVDGPHFPEIPGCRGLDGGTNAKTTRDGDTVGGTKSFSRILVPESAGVLELPALQWTAFDPHDRRYVTYDVPSRRLTVAAATGLSADDASRARIGSAIRGIRTRTRLHPRGMERPWDRVDFWAFQLVPIAGVAAAYTIKRRRDRIDRDPVGSRMRQAPRKLRSALASVTAERSDPWGALVRAVDGFLADRYGPEVRGMTRADLPAFLVGERSDPEVAASLASLLAEADTLRYTPALSGGASEGIPAAIGKAADLCARLPGGRRG
jgi:hypothetical protein